MLFPSCRRRMTRRRGTCFGCNGLCTLILVYSSTLTARMNGTSSRGSGEEVDRGTFDCLVSPIDTERSWYPWSCLCLYWRWRVMEGGRMLGPCIRVRSADSLRCPLLTGWMGVEKTTGGWRERPPPGDRAPQPRRQATGGLGGLGGAVTQRSSLLGNALALCLASSQW